MAAVQEKRGFLIILCVGKNGCIRCVHESKTWTRNSERDIEARPADEYVDARILAATRLAALVTSRLLLPPLFLSSLLFCVLSLRDWFMRAPLRSFRIDLQCDNSHSQRISSGSFKVVLFISIPKKKRQF